MDASERWSSAAGAGRRCRRQAADAAAAGAAGRHADRRAVPAAGAQHRLGGPGTPAAIADRQQRQRLRHRAAVDPRPGVPAGTGGAGHRGGRARPGAEPQSGLPAHQRRRLGHRAGLADAGQRATAADDAHHAPGEPERDPVGNRPAERDAVGRRPGGHGHRHQGSPRAVRHARPQPDGEPPSHGLDQPQRHRLGRRRNRPRRNRPRPRVATDDPTAAAATGSAGPARARRASAGGAPRGGPAPRCAAPGCAAARVRRRPRRAPRRGCAPPAAPRPPGQGHVVRSPAGRHPRRRSAVERRRSRPGPSTARRPADVPPGRPGQQRSGSSRPAQPTRPAQQTRPGPAAGQTRPAQRTRPARSARPAPSAACRPSGQDQAAAPAGQDASGGCGPASSSSGCCWRWC